jgi:riboflavin kinase/FMN adenylyltransferase
LIHLRTPQQAETPTAVALGSFDGVHAGHRRVIAAAVEASGKNLVPTVLSFWPHPREVLAAEPRLRLDLPEEKLELLEPLGIQQLVLVPFDLALAALSPEQFVTQVLQGQLRAGAIAVGTGSCLVNKALMAAKDYAKITQNAERFTRIVREAKKCCIL